MFIWKKWKIVSWIYEGRGILFNFNDSDNLSLILAELFDNPEATLQDFLSSGQPIMSITFKDSNTVIELNQRDAANLLIEYGITPEERE